MGYDKAENELLKLYHRRKLNTWIIDVNSNNLYGHSMTQLLPIKMLDLVDWKKIYLENWNPIGCFLQVDFNDLTIKVTISIKNQRR